MRSDHIIYRVAKRLGELGSMQLASVPEKTAFLREFLLTLNRFFYEYRAAPEIDALNEPDPAHPQWQRHTEFLAVWDDYSKEVLGIGIDDAAVDTLARTLLRLYDKAEHLRAVPTALPPDITSDSLGGLTPRQFALVRLVHALQDFTQELPPITPAFVSHLKEEFNGRVPECADLETEQGALAFLKVLGGADKKGDERKRYIQNICKFLETEANGDAYALYSKADGDACALYETLFRVPGLKSKKANMLLRDMYESGCWNYSSGLEAINIIADNRVMRIALRTGIVHVQLGKLLNDILDQYDFQYASMQFWAEDAYRRVWSRCTEMRGGRRLVSYPGRLDQFFYTLGGSCCRPNSRSCGKRKLPPAMDRWLKQNLGVSEVGLCPLASVCTQDKRILNPPFAVSNNTWNKIFTNAGGGGGISGI
jgi:hypothetical protein